MKNVRDQPRGDGPWIAAIRVPSLLDDALLSPRVGNVSAITSYGLRSTDDLGVNLGGSILG